MANARECDFAMSGYTSSGFEDTHINPLDNVSAYPGQDLKAGGRTKQQSR